MKFRTDLARAELERFRASHYRLNGALVARWLDDALKEIDRLTEEGS